MKVLEMDGQTRRAMERALRASPDGASAGIALAWLFDLDEAAPVEVRMAADVAEARDQLLLRNVAAWTRTWLQSHSALGACAEAVQELVGTFPELQVVRGHVETGWGRRAHWWAVTPTGKIVDPTVTQFPGGMVYAYDAFKPGDRVELGSCAWCGEAIEVALQSLDEPPPPCPHHCSDECADAHGRELSRMM